MFEVVSNEQLAPKVHRLVVRAPRVAAARRPGQFVIVRSREGAEHRIRRPARHQVLPEALSCHYQLLGFDVRPRLHPAEIHTA